MRVIVVGAGLAGLAAAEALHRAGVEVTVFEARDRVGEFVHPGHDAVRRVCARLGLTLFEKGTTYGDREPRGGIGVRRDELLAAVERVRAVAALRPDLALNPADPLLTTGHDDPWARGVYSICGLGGLVDEAALRVPVGPITFAGEHTAETLAPRVPADVP